MAKFDINRKGYDIEQVDNYISKLSLKYEEKLSEQKDRVFSLKNELSLLEERLENYKDKDKQISQALIFAVEKAEQIEANASKLYDLEIKRLRLLYKSWEEVLQKFENVKLPVNLGKEVGDFKTTLNEVIEQNKRIGVGVIRKDLHNNSDNYIRNLLNKMDYAINKKPKTPSKTPIAPLSEVTEKENNRLIDLSSKLDSIKVEGKGNMVDNYLKNDDIEPSAFAKLIAGDKPIKNEAFDLDAILKPEEDLEEIMRAFDFFISEEQ